MANALKMQGFYIRFICKRLPNHLVQKLKQCGHDLALLDPNSDAKNQSENHLKLNQLDDVNESLLFLSDYKWDWLVVDHYGIDSVWHKVALTHKCVNKIAVIDDLANRQHHCSLLVDQTLNRKNDEYKPLVPFDCKSLVGSNYAILRPEFLEWRNTSLKNKESGQLKKVLITLGGGRNENEIIKVLNSISDSILPSNVNIVIILGSISAKSNTITHLVKELPWDIELLSDVDNMAELMAESDLVIGASGTTSWERCCLGVPSITLVLAENQVQVAKSLALSNAVLAVTKDGLDNGFLTNCINSFVSEPEKIREFGMASSILVDGLGANRIIEELMLW